MDGERLGKYELRGTLGRGAMGTVYEGWDPVISRKVAIKTVRLPDTADAEAQEELARFKREAQAAGRLNHPNIVGVFDYGETPELAYIVMEFIDGQSLKAVLDRQERFAVTDVVGLMEQLLAGLQFSHERGVVHRDIKPANVMLTAGRQVKIADFGIARIESSSMTQAGTVLGTPAYMSPEQFMGQTVDARTDIYSSGVLLYQLLTGERPYEGSMSAIMHKALNTEPPKPSDLSVTAPPGFDAVIAKAMAKRPEQRFADANAFARALRGALEQPAAAVADSDATMVAAPRPPERPAAPPPPVAAASAPRRGSRLPVLLAGVAGLVVIGGGIGWYVLQPGAPEQAVPVAAPAPAVSAPVVSAPAVSPPAVSPPAVSPPAVSPPAVSPPAVSFPAVPAPAPTPSNPPAAAPAHPATVAPTPASPAPTPPAPPAPAPVRPAPVQPAPVQPAPAQSTPAAPAPVPAAPAPTPAPVPSSSPAAKPAPVQPQAAQPVPVPAPAPPAPSLAALRAAVQPIACTLARVQLPDATHVDLDGLSGSGGPETALRRAIAQAAPAASLDWRVAAFSGPYCGVLDVLRAAGGEYRLGMALRGNIVHLHKDDFITVDFATPDFPAHLQLDYFSSDGTMTHLVADNGTNIRYMTGSGWKITGASRTYRPGSAVPIGEPDPKTGEGSWQVDQPYGTDMIVAVASSAPLFAAVRPADDTPAAYLRDLQTAIDAARARGTKLAAQALLVDTAPK